MARSILAAHDIPYFVHNGGYASLHPGMQIGLLNVPTVMVPPSAAQFATELLRAYLSDVEDHLHPRAERSAWHILRMILETIACGWFVRRIGAKYQPTSGEATSLEEDETTSGA